jgi:hypothetical protein
MKTYLRTLVFDPVSHQAEGCHGQTWNTSVIEGLAQREVSRNPTNLVINVLPTASPTATRWRSRFHDQQCMLPGIPAPGS